MVRKIRHEACGLQDMALRVWMTKSNIKKDLGHSRYNGKNLYALQSMNRIWNGS
jgi:hypothetical protein